jgi:hypothetical protein
MQERLITDAVVEIVCECGEVFPISAKDDIRMCKCGRRYALELRVNYWEKGEPILVSYKPEEGEG